MRNLIRPSQVRYSWVLAALLLASVSAADPGIGLSPWQFFLGNREDLEKVVTIAFQPDEGLKLRKRFQEKYGERGEKLVSSFGDGASPQFST